ncbi:hypothetical protein GGI08_003051 [Coemansia sp. S2]|nr:hypothetical protein GGI08_003051 [Coemansia sp. S2]
MAPSRKAVDNYNEYQANFVAFILWIKQVDSGECSEYPFTLSLWDAITLIRSLPLLSDLETGTLGLGELPRDVSMASLPEYVRSNYAPMGKRFRCWHTYEDHEREQFMAAMQEKIAEPGFSQDAPRLGRLLREKWKD